jgi:hypothetical protein
MGKILDLYFRFAAGGDYYLGQLLTLKDPSKVEFNVACPHWKDPDHPTIRHAINQSFGSVILSHEFTDHDPHAVLSLLLASMVHHSGWILHVCDKYPTHPFHQLPLINDLELLADLKENHLTLELNVHVPEMRGGWQIHKRGIRKVATQKRKRPRNAIPAGEDILQDDPTLTMNDAELEAQADDMMDALGM